MKLNKKIIMICISALIIGMYLPGGTVKRIVELGSAAILLICLIIELVSKLAARLKYSA